MEIIVGKSYKCGNRKAYIIHKELTVQDGGKAWSSPIFIGTMLDGDDEMDGHGVECFTPDGRNYIGSSSLLQNNLEEIEKEEVEEVTMEDVCKKYGKLVKIVKKS